MLRRQRDRQETLRTQILFKRSPSHSLYQNCCMHTRNFHESKLLLRLATKLLLGSPFLAALFEQFVSPVIHPPVLSVVRCGYFDAATSMRPFRCGHFDAAVSMWVQWYAEVTLWKIKPGQPVSNSLKIHTKRIITKSEVCERSKTRYTHKAVLHNLCLYVIHCV